MISKDIIGELLQHTLEKLGFVADNAVQIQIEPTKDPVHGDLASNVALVLSKQLRKPPRQVAEQIVAALPAHLAIEKVQIAGPGFINFFLAATALTQVVETILKEKNNFGRSAIGRRKKVLIEFVSSNPTGPLHVGHGRHAAFGMVVSNLLDAVGFDVYREYYLNDAGRQVDILTVSVFCRYLTFCGKDLPLPANGYQGAYIQDIAAKIFAENPNRYDITETIAIDHLPLDAALGGDKEIYIDAFIVEVKKLLGDRYEALSEAVIQLMSAEMRDDLAEFGVEFDNWFSEKSFVQSGAVAETIKRMQENGLTYEADGAVWFRSTDFGDEKDRVLVRANGQYTYFAPDLAYHLNKFSRGFDLAIDIFGSDHHGYIQRMQAAMQANGINPERLITLLVQFVTLYRGGEVAQMSTRAGSFVTLRELRYEVGNDAARYFYVMRKNEQPMDFDLDLAKSKSNENPVFYVQYAHARICSVFKQLEDRSIEFFAENGLQQLNILNGKEERDILNTLARYPGLIAHAAINYEPYQITNYLRDLAAEFHAYYNSQHFIVEDQHLRDARLTLILAVKQVLTNGFNLLGISAPTTM